LKILFVEDNTNTARASKAVLEMHGYSVDIAESVADALDSLRANKYDLLISDMTLPDGTGFDVLAQSPKPVRAIALSGYTTDADRDHALASGFASFIAKPYKTADLIAAIEKGEIIRSSPNCFLSF
jgi:DNA-binding response OmpR family regulator